MPSQTTPIVYTDLHLPQLPFPSRFATVQGARMHYLQAGDPKGDPILLLHGNPTWSYLWRGVIPPRAQRARRRRRPHRPRALGPAGH